MTALLVLVLVGLLGWLVSLRVHPWRHCPRCGGTPRSYGKSFPKAFRICARCGGTGRQLRVGARMVNPGVVNPGS